MKSKSSKTTTTTTTPSNNTGMSSDVDDDQVLPDSLQKLEIVPVYSHSLVACKTNIDRNQNPFLTELSTANSVDDRITKDLFGPSCSNCKSTDKPCNVNSMSSIENDMENQNWRYRGSNSSNSNNSNGSNSSSSTSSNNNSSSGNCSGASPGIVHSINKTIHFKHRDREKASSQLLSEKKLAILREPILKSIGRSVYHNGNKNKSCCEVPKSCVEHKCPKDERTNVMNSAAAGTQAEMHHTRTAVSSGSAAATAGQHKSCDQCTNERAAAVADCQNDSNPNNKINCQRVASTSAVDPNNLMIHRIQNWRLADDENVVDFKSLVNTCRNLTLCAHGSLAHNSIIELHKTRNFQILQANQIDNTAGTSSGDANDANLLSSNDGLYPNVHAAATASTGSNAMNCGLNNNNSSNSSNSSSCSQQARMNSNNCDVTIDELASYIEFELHLPKPMSSNVYEAMFS